MKTYLYKLKHKYTKEYNLLTKYGFLPYKDEAEEETFYSIPIKLNKDGAIYKYLVRALEKIYTHATTEERESDFKEYEFTEILNENQERDYKITITPELEKELTECQLCIVDKNIGANCLFINAPDKVEYYSTTDLDENCKEIIDRLIEDKVIYKKKAMNQRKR